MFQARSVFSDDELLMLKRKSQWRAAWMIFHAWAVIFGAMALFVWWPNPLTFIAACGYMLYASVVYARALCLLGIVALLVGIPLFLIGGRKAGADSR